jgi:hypothetical protein
MTHSDLRGRYIPCFRTVSLSSPQPSLSYYSITWTAKLPDPIDSILPKAIESALRLDATPEVRSAAVNLFGRLTVPLDGMYVDLVIDVTLT